jgi:iron-sulfur cluster assembly protein
MNDRPSPVTLTEAASQYILGQLASDDKASGFRLSMSKKGCGDGKYVAELAAEPKPSDMVVNYEGVTLYIDLAAQLHLFGMEIDYKNTPFESGLVFNNPNEKGRCGCGESVIF